MKKIILLLSLLCLGVVSSFAQIKITGQVTDITTAEPLEFVTVYVEGTKITSFTDMEGRYSISVPEGTKELCFQFTGYLLHKASLEGKTEVNVQMEMDQKMLDEVVVIGYGTQVKGAVTSSVTTVKTESLTRDANASSIESVLNGAVAGVSISTGSGQSGSASSTTIRGIGSFNASTQPLYIVDGVPMEQGNFSLTGSGSGLSSLTTINPNDIETVSVLKDAAAAAMYGSKGANGVILITTKRGSVGKVTYNFKGNWSISDWAVNYRPMVSGDDQHLLIYEQYYNQAIYLNGATATEAAFYAKEYADLVAPFAPTKGAQIGYSDWEKALFRDYATTSSYEFSARGGDQVNKFYASLAYRNEVGKYRSGGMDNYTGRFNFNHSKDKLQIGANISISYIDQVPISEGAGDLFNPIFAIKSYLWPNIPIYNPDGSYYEGDLFNLSSSEKPNLVKEQSSTRFQNKTFRTSNTLWSSYEIIKGLELKETLSFDYIQLTSLISNPSDSWAGEAVNGATQKIMLPSTTLYSSTLLSYNTVLKEHHTVKGLVGWDVSTSHGENIQAAAQGFPLSSLYELSAAATPLSASSGFNDDRLLSAFARVEYDYKYRYLLNFSYRRDGSSRLRPDNRWADFWAVSGAWRIKDEAFMKNVTFFDDLKLRLSYGVNGTLPSSFYGGREIYTATTYNGQGAIMAAGTYNPYLTWEKNYGFDAGLDIRFLRRFNLVVDFYNRRTKDLLQSMPVSKITGQSSYLANIGELSNTGIEVDLRVDLINTKDWQWNAGLILTHNRNIVKKLSQPEIVTSPFILKEGEHYNTFYLAEYAGVDRETGKASWYRNNVLDDGTIDRSVTSDIRDENIKRTMLGKATPDVEGSLRSSLSWKGWELGMQWNYSFGGKKFDSYFSYGETDGLANYFGIAESQLGRWREPGDVTDVPVRMYDPSTTVLKISSRYIYNNNYVRLKALSLSYTLPQQLVKKIGLSHARLNLSGNNLLTFKSDHPFDPEGSILEGFNFPIMKSFSFGLEIGF